MNILVDCGASDGSTIGELDRKFGPFDKIYAIEPNPTNARKIDTNDRRINMIEAAISTAYGEEKLYLSEQYDGSTLYPDKLSGCINRENFIDVEVIDFSDWLRKNVNKADYVVCKMDVEGAEFEVLEHLIRTKKMALIDKLFVEWHPSRFPHPWRLRYRRFLIKSKALFLKTTIKSWR